MPRWWGLAKPARWGALLAGALPVLCFPAPNLEFLAWVGLVPGLLIFRSAPSARESAVLGWWFGTGFMLAAHYWLAPNIGPGLLLAALAFGALWCGVSVSSHLLLRAPMTVTRALAALVVVPSFWLVIEWVRSWQWFGGPWALLGTSQWQHPVVLALAALGGVWLVSFTLVAANTAIVIAVTATGRSLLLLGAGAAAVAVAAGPAAFALAQPPPTARAVTVALVQPGIVHDPARRARASELLTHGLLARHPTLIVWGESSVAADLWRDPVLRERVAALAAGAGAPILVNQDSRVRAGKSKVAVLVGPRGIVGSYTKTRLVPFGEYIPFRRQLGWLTRISRAAPANLVPGDGAHVLTVPRAGAGRLTIGPLICFESAFPDMARADARHDAALLVYQTSDSTFQQSWAPAQHASLAAVRAAETGRPAVQAALSGDSVAFDARGRLLAWLPSSAQGILLARVAPTPPSYLTVFDRIGDVVPWGSCVIAVLAAGLALFVYCRPHRPAAILLEGNHRPAPSVSITEPSSESGHAPPPHDPDRGAG